MNDTPPDSPEGSAAGPTPPEAPVPEAAPAPEKKKRCWYHCRLAYLLSAPGLIVVAMAGVVLLVRYHPYWLVLQAIQYSRVPVQIGSARWTHTRGLRLQELSFGDLKDPFLRIDHVDVDWDWYRLLRYRQIKEVDIVHGRLSTGKLTDYVDTHRKTDAQEGLFRMVNQVTIVDCVLMLDELGPNVPSIPIPIGRSTPTVFQDLYFGRTVTSPNFSEERHATVEDIEIHSPWDAISPVLFFQQIVITYKMKDLWEGHITKVEIHHPIIYLGQDLFWFTDQFAKRKQSPATEHAQSWFIDSLAVDEGQLAVTVFGRPSVTLPFYFVSNASNINLGELDKMTINNQITIYKQDLHYPEYKINVDDLEGNIEFSVPPSDAHADNVVQTIHIKQVSWSGIAMTDAWASVTFDGKGIFGNLGGKSYDGYVKGDFSIFFQGGFPWEANLYATTVNVGPVAQKMISKYVNLTGTLNGTLNVKGLSTDIQHCWGNLKMLKAGVLDLEFIPDMIKKISPDWTPIKRELAKIGLEAFETYHYDKGELDFDYHPPTSMLSLKLDGREGMRNFLFNWHMEPSSEVAKGPVAE